MPIAAAERKLDGAERSVSFFPHKNKDRYGNPNTKVFGVSNCHVLCKKTTVRYKFKAIGAPHQLV